MKKEIVWVLLIEHKHGKDISVFATEKGAHKAVFEYVRECWSDYCDEPMPKIKQEAVEMYFGNAGDYQIDSTSIQP